jgi:integrase
VVAETHYRIECGRGQKENVAASTQNHALSALLFLYRQELNQDRGPIDALRAKKPKRLPTVLTRDEVHREEELAKGYGAAVILFCVGRR